MKAIDDVEDADKKYKVLKKIRNILDDKGYDFVDVLSLLPLDRQVNLLKDLSKKLGVNIRFTKTNQGGFS